MKDLSHDGDERTRGCDEAGGWNAMYRSWAANVQDMIEAWALQRGVDLVVFSTPEVRPDPARPPTVLR